MRTSQLVCGCCVWCYWLAFQESLLFSCCRVGPLSVLLHILRQKQFVPESSSSASWKIVRTQPTKHSEAWQSTPVALHTEEWLYTRIPKLIYCMNNLLLSCRDIRKSRGCIVWGLRSIWKSVATDEIGYRIDTNENEKNNLCDENRCTPLEVRKTTVEFSLTLE